MPGVWRADGDDRRLSVRALQNTGWMPRLITADGSDWRRLDWNG